MTLFEYRIAVMEACKARFAEMQGHAPSDHYEDGYADACAACVDAIEKIPLPSQHSAGRTFLNIGPDHGTGEIAARWLNKR